MQVEYCIYRAPAVSFGAVITDCQSQRRIKPYVTTRGASIREHGWEARDPNMPSTSSSSRSKSNALPPVPHITFTEPFGANGNAGRRRRRQTETDNERQPLLAPSDLHPRNDNDDDHDREHRVGGDDDEDDYPDSDGLYPPNCTWTSDQPNPPKGADPYENSRCNVYENIHRSVVVLIIIIIWRLFGG